ncbi:MAG: Ig-like domain-containing protein [Rubrivivax sp.]
MKTITPLTPSTQMTPVTQTTLITPITPLTRTCPRPLHRSSQTATLTVRVARFVLSATAGAALVACGGGGGSDSSASPPANEAPTVAISQPTANANFAAGQPITIDANALDSDGTVVRVEFFEGATKLGEDTSAPFAFVWTDAAPGSHTVTVRAFDNMGAMSSADVSLVVGLPGAPPHRHHHRAHLHRRRLRRHRLRRHRRPRIRLRRSAFAAAASAASASAFAAATASPAGAAATFTAAAAAATCAGAGPGSLEMSCADGATRNAAARR